jgi:hypothetical protein
MASIYYILTGIVLYFAADWVLRRIEAQAGHVLEHRTLVFFALIATMAVVSFAVIRALLR